MERGSVNGLTWEDRPFPETGSLVGLALATGEEETLFAAMGNRIHRSVDDGSSWTLAGEVGESDLQTLAAQPGSGRLWAVAAEGIYRSSDRGGWQRVHEAGRKWLFGFSSRDRPSPIRVRFDPHDNDRLFVVTPRELLETRDGGETWHSTGRTIAGYPWFSDVAISPVDPEALFVATSWGIYRLDGRATAVAPEPLSVPGEFSLDQNYPNPFNSNTTIRFSVLTRGHVQLTIYNLAGQKARTVLSTVLVEGNHTVSWDGRDSRGNELASGMYLYRLQAGKQVETRKLLLLR